ncbi:hypothetical protein LB507_002813 [Fusarium sp. FIESC RH6]|nr:hypothetical protein LB507_002813 [Fusarium sp. FIESC RH6]
MGLRLLRHPLPARMTQATTSAAMLEIDNPSTGTRTSGPVLPVGAKSSMLLLLLGPSRSTPRSLES